MRSVIFAMMLAVTFSLSNSTVAATMHAETSFETIASDMPMTGFLGGDVLLMSKGCTPGDSGAAWNVPKAYSDHFYEVISHEEFVERCVEEQTGDLPILGQVSSIFLSLLTGLLGYSPRD